ncbi:hypothetical protein [Nocardia gipuzkoensis]
MVTEPRQAYPSIEVSLLFGCAHFQAVLLAELPLSVARSSLAAPPLSAVLDMRKPRRRRPFRLSAFTKIRR